MNVSVGLKLAKDLAAAMGVGGILWSAYSVSGLPVPATIKQVEERITVVTKRIDGLSRDQLEGQRIVLRLTRVSLRNEQTALEQVAQSNTIETGTKRTLSRRLAEISDELKILDDRDETLRKRIESLQP